MIEISMIKVINFYYKNNGYLKIINGIFSRIYILLKVRANLTLLFKSNFTLQIHFPVDLSKMCIVFA